MKSKFSRIFFNDCFVKFSQKIQFKIDLLNSIPNNRQIKILKYNFQKIIRLICMPQHIVWHRRVQTHECISKMCENAWKN